MSKKRKNNFLDVDLSRAEYGDVSVKAIYELYRVKSKCTQEEFRKASFKDMVDFLRKTQ